MKGPQFAAAFLAVSSHLVAAASFHQVRRLPVVDLVVDRHVVERAFVADEILGNGWELVGCYVDVGRTINAASTKDDDMTNAMCAEFCYKQGFSYAGTEYYSECYCGHRLATDAALATDSDDCSTACSGNSSQSCGGSMRLTLWHNPTMSVTSQPLKVTVGSTTWDWYGCQTEATNARALISASFTDTTNMTLEHCGEYCSGYVYFGAEYGQECYCGNSFNADSTEAAASDCSMICTGDKLEYCGAGNRLSVYTNKDVKATTPAAPSLPDGWSDYGCWVDIVHGRILPYQAPDSDTLTLESCVSTCAAAGYSIAGAEYSYQCFCGNSIINGGVQATKSSECSSPCRGKSSEFCGGPDRMTILSKGEPAIHVAPAPMTSGLNGSWAYSGCAEDNVKNTRTFPWQIIMPNMTPGQCVDQCAEYGFMAAGLEYGRECYCGDPANMATTGATFRPESECNVNCAGKDTAICGGPDRMTTYFWNGTEPLYKWDIPEAGDPAAGAYEFLIGGVCVPLITSQAITGKVIFLEKSGTGPPNSTGAYELDLSQIDNFSAAWKTMHVKTDIFCSALLTLPDNAGRLFNAGGWSGDSTYGVRLYTPDGSDGVKGANDWEENVSELSLQNGRWYPSAMIMTNGSILVVGGEEGSNGAAVPTLEILPSTGTKPLYMEWLARTDPNNLYPYLFVLPSGGIFVGYWNEARILDPVTFSTRRILPNMPGTVSNPYGGRTYPLEGTAVLLPQHAPYTDPVTVLVCGGSTEGTGYAIDNCVSTQPDVEGAEWVIERMPSRRVMSCMAPLPDGTYLINNGAQQGVAGFGLGSNPNLNALLYDPRKPLHQRFTVAANTTVARLYHSESITLLDGRVLVSGSDPQDGTHPQEYRIEVFTPPYLHSGRPRPTFTLAESQRNWSYGGSYTFNLGGAAQNGNIEVSLLGSVGSTHGNSMGARTVFPAVSCSGTTCTVEAPPQAEICPPGWYQFFVLDGGIPAIGVYVRIGHDPAELGNWPKFNDFTTPGV